LRQIRVFGHKKSEPFGEWLALFYLFGFFVLWRTKPTTTLEVLIGLAENGVAA
jgi:hypothetical protein